MYLIIKFYIVTSSFFPKLPVQVGWNCNVSN